MRDALFRGKSPEAGCIVFGSLVQHPSGKNYIVKLFPTGGLFNWIYVYPETVGQYTGVKDKDGKKIFDGDLVKTKCGRICKVVWFQPKMCWDLKPVANLDCDAPDEFDLWHSENLEVIGNIHDNPELLES